MPASSTFARSDWEILAGFWHPVAYAEEVAKGPVSATLLDVELVLYRSGGGVVAALDRCSHRGTKLSLGHVTDGCAVCPYHGLLFGEAGACRGRPGMNGPLPGLNLATQAVSERFGIIWVCLRPAARFPLPDWRELEQADIRSMHLSDVWEAAASRHAENFTDLAHVSFVHASTFGDPAAPEIPPYAVEHDEQGLTRMIRYQEIDFDDVTGQNLGPVPTLYRYRLSLPFATWLSIEYPHRPIRHFMDVPSPISARRSRIFLIAASPDPRFDPHAYHSFQSIVNREDRKCPWSAPARKEPIPCCLPAGRAILHIPQVSASHLPRSIP